MKTATRKAPSSRKAPMATEDRTDAAYLELIRQYPLRPIRTKSHYAGAAAMLDKLVLRDDLSVGERDYLDVLTGLVEVYDRAHFQFAVARTPLERLKAAMEDAEVTPAQLQEILGLAQPSVSMIMNGKRALSKQSILKLAERFKVDSSYFL